MTRSTSVVLLGLYYLVLVDCQFSQSPCPGTFEYKSDGSGVYGLIQLQPSGPVTIVMVRANFTIASRLPSSYVGRLEPIGAERLLLQDFNRGTPIMYRVHFPVTSPLPRLTSLMVNDNTLCYGPADVPGPNQYVTTISLQHVLYLRNGQGGQNVIFNQFKPAPSKNPDPDIVDFLGPINNDGQIYTFTNDGNRQGSWNSNNNDLATFFDINNSRPEFIQPQQPVTRRPTRPQYTMYYPEQTTEVYRPQPRPTPPPQPITQPPPPPPPQPQDRLPSFSDQSNQCGVISGGNERIPLIYNGQNYARGDWPWLTAIYKRNDGSLNFICAGTLVSNRHVITAAHCMHQKNTITRIKDIVVKVGVYNLEDWGDEITVTRTLESAVVHENYNSSTLENDILVLTFERTVEFTVNIRPACLWSGRTDLSKIVGTSGVVAGWGRSELGPAGRGEPRMITIPVVSTTTCRASKPEFHKLTSANTLCAGDRNGAGPCLGDSGGGLYLLDNGRWRLRGVVSLSLRPENGENMCNLNEYIIFTDSAQYLSWMKNHMNY